MKKLFGRGSASDEAKAEAAKAEAAKAEAAIQRAEALYSDMQRAIQKKNYVKMRAIIGDPDYDPNRVGAVSYTHLTLPTNREV